MSGPQGSDPTQHWTGGQQPDQPAEQPSSDPSANQPWQSQPAGSEPTTAAPQWQPPAYDATQQQQPPAYDPTQQQQPYPQYPQQPGYQAPQEYQQPTEYNPQAYPQQQGQYAQPGYDPSSQYATQYGQPGQYGQQPGQYGQPGQYPQQPGQFGQPGSYGAAPGTEEGSKRSLAVIGGVIGLLAAVIVAVVLVMGFWKPGFFVTTKLDIDAAQTGVQRVLTDEADGYGAKNVQNVKCNDGQNPTVEKGGTFDCEVSIDGTKRQVTVTFQDDSGTYEVGRPK
jgi:hypothetical protein